MVYFIVRILGNTLGLYAAFWLVPGFIVNGGIKEFLLAGLVLSILNLVVRPILKLISFPIIMLTLGLFTIVINALLLWVVDYIFSFITISNLTALVWATIIIGIVNIFIPSRKIAKAI